MTHSALTKELIGDTSAMRLILRIEPKRLSALIVGPESVDPTVIAHSEEIADESVRALENAIYDNPLLLGDFAAIDIIFADSDFFLLPRSAEPLLDELAEALLPDCCCQRTVMMEPLPGEAAVGFAPDSDRLNFLSRTFACARFHHSPAIVANRLMTLPDAGGLYALVNSATDVCLCSLGADGSLRYLNRPQTFGAADCAYYILAAAEANEPITLITANNDLRAAITDTITKVKPAARILPPAFGPEMLALRRLAPEAASDMLFLARS